MTHRSSSRLYRCPSRCPRRTASRIALGVTVVFALGVVFEIAPLPRWLDQGDSLWLGTAQAQARRGRKSGRKRPAKRSTSKPAKRSTSKPAKRSTSKSAPRPAQKSAPQPAKGPAKGPAPRRAPTKDKVFDFTGLDISGQLRAPQLLYFLDRATEELEQASLERRSFLPEMVRSLDEEAL